MRFHVDDPDGPHVQSYADRYLEVNVEGEWGLVCFEALSRSVLTVLCRDLEGKFGQWSRPGTPRYYSSTKRLVHTLGPFPHLHSHANSKNLLCVCGSTAEHELSHFIGF